MNKQENRFHPPQAEDARHQNNRRRTDTSKPKAQSLKLKIIPLGGVEEIGINCTVYEHNNDIVIVDLGLGFSEFGYYGIDAVVPNIEYLTQKKNRIKGLVITHGHLDHIGGIQYHIEELGFPPIYGTQFTIELIKLKLEEKGLLGKVKLNVITDETILQLGSFKIQFFHVNHSIPQCVGVLLETAAGRAVQTGDFKFDNTPINEPVADYAKISQFGKMGIDILLSDSTNSLKKGHPASESSVAKNLEDIVERASGRVIVATFSGLVGRLYQLLQIAKKHNRKVAIAGYSMNQTLRIAQEIGFIKIDSGLVIPIQGISKLAPDKVLILTTGAQGESDAALSKMAVEDYKGFQLTKGDTVILSAKTITGNDRAVQNLVDSITRRGAFVKQIEENLDLFTSGHGYQEDQKIMLNLIKPNHFMPVHGYQYFLQTHGQTAKTVGVKEENIIISQRGSIIEGNKIEGFKIIKKFNCEPLLVSGSGVGDVGAVVLREREQLANYGIVLINMTVDKDKKLLRTPFVLTKGFVYVKASQELLQDIAKIAENVYNEVAPKNLETAELRDEITMKIEQLVVKETGREPMIMVVINYI